MVPLEPHLGLQGRRVEGKHALEPCFTLGRNLQLHTVSGPRRDQDAPGLQVRSGACARVDRRGQQRDHRADQWPAPTVQLAGALFGSWRGRRRRTNRAAMSDRRAHGPREDGPHHVHAVGPRQHGRFHRSARRASARSSSASTSATASRAGGRSSASSPIKRSTTEVHDETCLRDRRAVLANAWVAKADDLAELRQAVAQNLRRPVSEDRALRRLGLPSFPAKLELA